MAYLESYSISHKSKVISYRFIKFWILCSIQIRIYYSRLITKFIIILELWIIDLVFFNFLFFFKILFLVFIFTIKGMMWHHTWHLYKSQNIIKTWYLSQLHNTKKIIKDFKLDNVIQHSNNMLTLWKVYRY